MDLWYEWGNLSVEVEKLKRLYAGLTTSSQNVPYSGSSSALNSRIEDLELWRAKMHAMLIEKSLNTGRERLAPEDKRVSALYANLALQKKA